jgi:hypothetical protein
MFIGSYKIDIDYLKRIYRKPELVKEYSNSLIPKEFVHIKELRDNQLYYICMSLRKIGILDYKELNESINIILKGLRITGYADELIEVSVIYNLINKDKLDVYLERL